VQDLPFAGKSDLTAEATARTESDAALQQNIDKASFPPLLTATNMADLYGKLNDMAWWGNFSTSDDKPLVRKIKVFNWMFTLIVTKSDTFTQFLFGPTVLNEDGTFNDSAYFESYILKRTVTNNGLPLSQWSYIDRTDFINIDAYKPISEGCYTLDTARSALPNSMRKNGIIITWKSASGEWPLKQFTGVYAMGTSTGEWSDNSKWKDIAGGEITAIESDISVLKKTAFKHLAADTNLDTITTPGAYYIGTQETADSDITPAAFSKDFLFVTGENVSILGKVNDVTQCRINKDGLTMRKHYTAEVNIGGTSYPAYWEEWQTIEAPSVSVAEGQEPKKIWVGTPGDLPPDSQHIGTKTLYITVENDE
jgi:hypothetical protein